MRKILILISLSILFTRCELVDTFDETPMYLDIPEISFSSTNSNISDNSQISDVWVFVDGFSVGVFPLPAVVPVLGEDNVQVSLFAGVRESGQVNVPVNYPFYERMEMEIPFQSGETIPVDFVTTYTDPTVLTLNDNFESFTAFDLDLDGDPASTITTTENTPFGNLAGRIEVTPETSNYRQGTSALFNVSDFQSADIYLELDHRNDVNFIVTISGTSNNSPLEQPVILLFPNDDWEKLYIDLSFILLAGDFDQFRIVIEGDGGAAQGFVDLDNIRLVHF